MNKKDLKTIIIISSVLIFISFISYLIFNGIENNKKAFNASIIVEGKEFWQYNKGNWQDLEKIDSIDWQEFKVYSENKYINNYFITTANNKTYFFDSNRESYKVTSPFLGISIESKTAPIDYTQSEFTEEDNKIINKYLNKNNINYNGEYSTKEKYSTVINTKQSNIYIISNELYSDEVFYIIFMRYDNKNITIIKQDGKIDKFQLAWILDININKMPTIILKKEYMEDYEYYLYTYDKNNEYKKNFEDL